MTMVGYIANNKGLLEFDGVAWNTYPIRNAKTRALELEVIIGFISVEWGSLAIFVQVL